MSEEIIYEQEGQAGAFNLLIAGGMAIGILIVILVIMNVVALQTYSASTDQFDAITDGNGLGFKEEAFDAINSGFEGYGTLGDFIPIVVIVAVAAIVLSLLGGFGRGIGGGGGMGL